TYLEKIIYLSLVIFMLPLGFFQQTRGFLVSYVKKIISLTFYMPLLLLLVLFNSFALPKTNALKPLAFSYGDTRRNAFRRA
ncbi:hypothetical protein B0X53_02100, partial [Helicobacter pylori]